MATPAIKDKFLVIVVTMILTSALTIVIQGLASGNSLQMQIDHLKETTDSQYSQILEDLRYLRDKIDNLE
jgi:hypothetical protein